MANSYTTYTIALDRGDLPTSSTTFEEIFELSKVASKHDQMIRSTSRRDWILGAVQVLMDAGYVSSLEILFQETAILAPEELMRRISELKFLLEQFANEPKKFTSLFSSYSDSYTDEEIQQAVKNTEPPLKPIEWYGDYDSLECLLHFLRRHLALFEFSLQRNLFIFYVRCERFLDSREA